MYLRYFYIFIEQSTQFTTVVKEIRYADNFKHDAYLTNEEHMG